MLNRVVAGNHLEIFMSWHFGNFFDLALESHVRFLQILDVLVLHLVHVDVLKNF